MSNLRTIKPESTTNERTFLEDGTRVEAIRNPFLIIKSFIAQVYWLKSIPINVWKYDKKQKCHYIGLVEKAGSRVATIKMLYCTTLHKNPFFTTKNLHGSICVCSLMAWEYVGFCPEVIIWNILFLERAITSKVQLCLK